MTVLGESLVHRPRSGPRVRRALLEGLGAGAVSGAASVSAIVAGPWWLAVATGFATAPLLLLASSLGLPPLPAAGVIILGCAMLFAAYGSWLAHCRSAEQRVAWIGALMLVHVACLIAWIGLFLSRVVGG